MGETLMSIDTDILNERAKQTDDSLSLNFYARVSNKEEQKTRKCVLPLTTMQLLIGWNLVSYEQFQNF